MKQITLNSNLVNIIVPDTYRSIIGKGEIIDSYVRSEDEENVIFREFSVNNDYYQYIMDVATDFYERNFANVFEQLGLKFVKIDGWYSPNYYNYSTDSFDITFELLPNFEQKKSEMIKRIINSEDAQKYMNNHYKSYIGFISFMPKNMNEFLEYENNETKEDYFFAAYIMLGLVELEYLSEYNAYQVDFEYNVCELAYKYIEEELLIDESLLELYLNDEKINEICWQLKNKGIRYYKHKAKKHYENVPQNNAAKLIIWAQDNYYTAEDLFELAEQELYAYA